MNKLTRPALLAAAAVLPLIANVSGASSETELAGKAKALNARLLNLDAHTDVLIEGTPERRPTP